MPSPRRNRAMWSAMASVVALAMSFPLGGCSSLVGGQSEPDVEPTPYVEPLPAEDDPWIYQDPVPEEDPWVYQDPVPDPLEVEPDADLPSVESCAYGGDPLCDDTIEVPPPDLGPWS